MIVRVAVLIFTALVAQYFQGAIGDDFIGIHIGGGASTALKHVDDKVVVQHAHANFIARLTNRIDQVIGNMA